MEKELQEQIEALMTKYGSQYQEEITATLKSFGVELKKDITDSVMSEVTGTLDSVIATREAIVDEKTKGHEHGFKCLSDFCNDVKSKD